MVSGSKRIASACVKPGSAAASEMSAMSEDIIFTPLRFRSLEVKNRIFRSNVSGRFDNEDGSVTQARINWESKFARGGVGAVISSFTPVTMAGRIVANYATIHRDDYIPLWRSWAKRCTRTAPSSFFSSVTLGVSSTCRASPISIEDH